MSVCVETLPGKTVCFALMASDAVKEVKEKVLAEKNRTNLPGIANSGFKAAGHQKT